MTRLEFRPCLLPRRRRCLFDMASCVFMECVEKEEGDGFWAQRRKKRVKKREEGGEGVWDSADTYYARVFTSGLLIREGIIGEGIVGAEVSKRGKGWCMRFSFRRSPALGVAPVSRARINRLFSIPKTNV